MQGRMPAITGTRPAEKLQCLCCRFTALLDADVLSEVPVGPVNAETKEGNRRRVNGCRGHAGSINRMRYRTAHTAGMDGTAGAA